MNGIKSAIFTANTLPEVWQCETPQTLKNKTTIFPFSPEKIVNFTSK